MYALPELNWTRLSYLGKVMKEDNHSFNLAPAIARQGSPTDIDVSPRWRAFNADEHYLAIRRLPL